MAFDSLTDKLNSIFSKLSGKGKLTESDVKSAMREVKMALLEADVNFKVVKQFVNSVQERAVGEEVMNGLNPAQMVIKIVNEEMTSLMGSETTELQLQPGKQMTVVWTSTVPRLSNSCRSTVRSRASMFSQWETGMIRPISRRRPSSMLIRTKRILSSSILRAVCRSTRR